MRSRPSWFLRLHARPWIWIAAAVAIAAGVLAVVAGQAGWAAVRGAFADVHPGWIAVCVLAQVVALAGYAIGYRAVATARDGPEMSRWLALRIVVAGFGAFAVGGGFLVDQRALRATGASPGRATVRILGLGALEYAVLAPAACACAIALLLDGGGGVQAAVLWPWAIAVPVGFGVGLWAAAPSRRERVRAGALRSALEGVALLVELGRRPVRHAGAWLGMAVYWAADIATLYGALRLFGVRLGVAQAVLGYATGYAATRRTLPLGGAGITEALLSVSLVWAGLPLARAVPAVAAYRVANFLLPLVPSERAHRSVMPMIEEAEAAAAQGRAGRAGAA